jgi:hypothetical protein
MSVPVQQQQQRRAYGSGSGNGSGSGSGSGGGGSNSSIQSGLDERSFAERLTGYDQIVPQDLLEARGGFVRYAVDTLAADGTVRETQYRLGGILTRVDPDLRYIRLLNPYAKAAWSVQLNRNAGERLRVWYKPPATSDEINMFRNLLGKLESGDIQINKIQ